MRLSSTYSYWLLYLFVAAVPGKLCSQQGTGKFPLAEMNRPWVDLINDSIYKIKDDFPYQALPLAQKALKVSEQLSYPEGKARAYSRLGMVYNVLMQYDSAIYYFQQSLDYRLEKGLSQRGISIMHAYLGNTYILKGAYARAISHLKAAVELQKGLNNKKELAAAYNDLAIGYKLRAERRLRAQQPEASRAEGEQAIKYYKKSLVLYEAEKEWGAYADICNKLSSLFRMKDQADSTLYYLDRAEFLFDSLRQHKAQPDSPAYLSGLLDTYLRKGRCYDHINRFEEAFIYHQRALEISRQLEDSLSLFMVLINLGESFLLQKKFQQARRCYLEALAMSKKKEQEPVMLKTLYLNLSAVCDSLKQYSQALSFLNRGMALSMKIGLEEEQARIEDAAENIRLESNLKEIEAQKRHQRNLFRIAIAGSATLLILAAVIIWSFWKNQRIQNILTEKREKEREEALVNYLKAAEQKILNEKNELQENLLERVGRELHDGLGSSLVAARLKLENLNHILEPISPKALNLSKNIYALIKTTYEEMRKVSADLENLSLEGGLIFSLNKLCDDMNGMKNSPKISLMTTGHGNIALSPKIEFNVFRIIQEALANVIKHARAENVNLQLIWADNTLNVTIEDDGIGFDPNSTKDNLGLNNIKSRVHSMGGTLTLDTAPGKGASLFIDIPVSVQLS
ncbi:MAG: sensor histidine kinase [Lewinellaceae bacterium]|nr:sensor histidine kinase [Lewinellaceae bacterium]